ncbi:MAG TPA: IclR family transcriptional regulator [Burkholderiaceae bacterium]|nr:IclR family transcriptional regulator [Burkholderiaceae bacterium]
MTEDTEKYSVPGLERGLRILALFSRQTPTLTAPEIEQQLELPRTTVFRLLVTLERMGFVERLANGREFQPGTAVLKLGFKYLAPLALTQLGYPVLNTLCQQTDYASNLVVRDHTDIVYILRASPPTIFSGSVHVGTRLPAHATVLGRVLLSQLSETELHELYPNNALPLKGEHTPKTVDELYKLLQDDYKRGFVAEDGFFESHISTVAAPVFGLNNRLVAAISLTLTGGKIPDDERDALIQAVCFSAQKLSAKLQQQHKTEEALPL